MKPVLVAVCCIALCSIPALAKSNAAKASGMTDQQFVNFAAQTDMVEANLGQLAETVSDSTTVKDLGKMLANDHTQDYQQLTGIAQQAGFTMPTSIDAKHKSEMITPMHKLSGKAFDHRYVQAMVSGHSSAIDVFKKEAKDAQNAALKSYAQGDLMTLEKHLAAAKALSMVK